MNSVYLGSVASCIGGNKTADLYVDLAGNRQYYCVVLVVDVWVNGLLEQRDLTSTVTADWSGGARSFLVGTITWPCNQSVEIRNIYVQWAPNEGCTTGDCSSYKAPSKCIGNYPNVLVAAGNVPPTALDDRVSTNENESVRIDILANDADSDGGLNRATVTITRAPASGSTSVDPTMGTVTYVPAPGTCGEDSFRYTVRDDDGAVSGEATVTVAVVCNQPPVTDDDSATTDERTAIAIHVTANDHDPDGVLDLGSISISEDPG
ncbi:MAG: cadherin-like domain-containing protein, partial [bacterium]